MDRRRIIRRPDVPSAMITQAGAMTAITTPRPMIRGLASDGEPLGRRWLKNILTAALAGILYLVLIGVPRTASALITGKN